MDSMLLKTHAANAIIVLVLGLFAVFTFAPAGALADAGHDHGAATPPPACCRRG